MSELRKDLEAVEERMVREGWPSASRRAELLAELGYRKVVRCGECKHMQDIGFTKRLVCNKTGGLLDKTQVEGGWFCSAGERVVAKNATGEEGK